MCTRRRLTHQPSFWGLSESLEATESLGPKDEPRDSASGSKLLSWIFGTVLAIGYAAKAIHIAFCPRSMSELLHNICHALDTWIQVPYNGIQTSFNAGMWVYHGISSNFWLSICFILLQANIFSTATICGSLHVLVFGFIPVFCGWIYLFQP